MLVRKRVGDSMFAATLTVPRFERTTKATQAAIELLLHGQPCLNLHKGRILSDPFSLMVV